MSLKNNIKGVLGVIYKAIAQTPRDKQKMLGAKVQRVIEKYDGQKENT